LKEVVGSEVEGFRVKGQRLKVKGSRFSPAAGKKTASLIE
jgi:hypothetical protein